MTCFGILSANILRLFQDWAILFLVFVIDACSHTTWFYHFLHHIRTLVYIYQVTVYHRSFSIAGFIFNLLVHLEPQHQGHFQRVFPSLVNRISFQYLLNTTRQVCTISTLFLWFLNYHANLWTLKFQLSKHSHNTTWE